MKLQELVSHHASALNETDLAVWRYIESHPQECCYISIYDLANRCHVSRTSVLRFAKKLGVMPLGVEGEREAEWVLVDLGDVIVLAAPEIGGKPPRLADADARILRTHAWLRLTGHRHAPREVGTPPLPHHLAVHPGFAQQVERCSASMRRQP